MGILIRGGRVVDAAAQIDKIAKHRTFQTGNPVSDCYMYNFFAVWLPPLRFPLGFSAAFNEQMPTGFIKCKGDCVIGCCVKIHTKGSCNAQQAKPADCKSFHNISNFGNLSTEVPG